MLSVPLVTQVLEVKLAYTIYRKRCRIWGQFLVMFLKISNSFFCGFSLDESNQYKICAEAVQYLHVSTDRVQNSRRDLLDDELLFTHKIVNVSLCVMTYFYPYGQFLTYTTDQGSR